MRMGQGWGGWRPARWAVPLAFLLVSAAGAMLVYHVGARAYLFLELLQAVDITHPSLPTEIKSKAQGRPSPDFPLTARIERILPAGSVMHVQWSPDGTLVAASRIFDGRVTVWDRRSGKMVQEFKREFSDGEPLAFTADGKYLITGASGRGSVGHVPAFTLWSLTTGTVAKQVDGACEELAGADWNTADVNVAFNFAISPDGSRFATMDGCPSSMIHIYETKTWSIIGNIKEKQFYPSPSGVMMEFTPSPGSLAYIMAFSPDGKILATIGLTACAKCPSPRGAVGAVMLFDVATLANIRVIEAIRGPPRGVEGAQGIALSPDGRFLATGAYFFSPDPKTPGPVRVWRVADGTLAWAYQQSFENVGALAWDPQNRYLVSAADLSIILWPIAKPQAAPLVVAKYRQVPLAAAVTKDGQYIAAVVGGGIVIIHVSQ